MRSAGKTFCWCYLAILLSVAVFYVLLLGSFAFGVLEPMAVFGGNRRRIVAFNIGLWRWGIGFLTAPLVIWLFGRSGSREK